MDAHNASEQIEDFHFFTTESTQNCTDTVLCGIAAERIENIAVGSCVSAEDQTEERNDQAKIPEINRAPKKIARFAEIENEDATARLENAEQFGDSFLEIGEISETVTDRHNIESGCAEGKIESICLQVRNGRLTIPCHGEHGPAEIASHRSSASHGERMRDITGATANIQSKFVWLNGGDAQQAKFPKTVQAETLEIVDEIVAGGNTIKEQTHAGGAFCSFHVV